MSAALALALGSPAYADEFLLVESTDGARRGTAAVDLATVLGTGRDGFHVGVDHRFGLRFGLTDALETRVVVGAGASADEGELEVIEQTATFDGVRSEWRLSVLDGAEDPFGLVLVGVPAYGPWGGEVELGFGADDVYGRTSVGLVGSVAPGWVFRTGETGQFQLRGELGARIARAVGPVSSVGLAAFARSLTQGTRLAHVAAFVGPTITVRGVSSWGSLTVAPQLPAPLREYADRWLVLSRYDRLAIVLDVGTAL